VLKQEVKYSQLTPGRYGEFQNLIEKISPSFKEYGIELGGQYKFWNDRPVPGIKGVSDPKSLLFRDWPDRFFVAGKDPVGLSSHFNHQ
jgi:hypothetical protein